MCESLRLECSVALSLMVSLNGGVDGVPVLVLEMSFVKTECPPRTSMSMFECLWGIVMNEQNIS